MKYRKLILSLLWASLAMFILFLVQLFLPLLDAWLIQLVVWLTFFALWAIARAFKQPSLVVFPAAVLGIGIYLLAKFSIADACEATMYSSISTFIYVELSPVVVGIAGILLFVAGESMDWNKIFRNKQKGEGKADGRNLNP